MSYHQFVIHLFRILTLNGFYVYEVKYNSEKYDINHQRWRSSSISYSRDGSSTGRNRYPSIMKLLLRHPLKLANLVKSYYRYGNFFIIYLIILTFMLTHLWIKITIHMLTIGDNSKRLKFYDSIIYPDLAGATSDPKMLNNLFHTSATLDIIIWYLNLHGLFKRSIMNSNRYEIISISEFNFAFFSKKEFAPLMSPFHVLNGLLGLRRFKKNRKRFNEALIDVDYKLIQQTKSSLSKAHFKDIVFDHNLINFSKIYKEVGIDIEWYDNDKKFKLDSKSLLNKFYIPKPVHRTNVFSLIFGYSVLMSSTFIQILGMVSYVTGIIIIEINYRLGDKPRTLVNLMVLFDVIVVIRLFENFIMAFGVFQIHFLLNLFVWDCLVLVSRITKVVRLANSELKRLINLDIPIDRVKNEHLGVSYDLLDLDDYQTFDEKSNQYVQHLMLLIRVVKFEFSDLQKKYSIFINIMISGYCLSLPQSVSLFITDDVAIERVLIGLFTCSVVIPIVFILIFAARVELAVSITTYHRFIHSYIKYL